MKRMHAEQMTPIDEIYAIVHHSRGWYSARLVVLAQGQVWSVRWLKSGPLKEVQDYLKDKTVLRGTYAHPPGRHESNLLFPLPSKRPV